MTQDIIVGIVAMTLTGLVLQSGGTVARFSANQELVRKALHSASGLIVLATLLLVEHAVVFLVVVGVTGIVLVFIVHTQALPVILYGNKWRDYGLVCFAAGLFVTAALWWDHRAAVLAGAATLAFADAAAAVVGQRLGRHPIVAAGAIRSLEGSGAFALTAFAVVMLTLGVDGSLPLSVIAATAFVAALTSAALEAVVPSAIDNLVIIPWVAGLVVWSGFDPSALTWFAAGGTAVVLGIVFARMRWLDLPGTLAAVLVVASVVVMAGWSWLAPLATFFVVSSLLSHGGERPSGSPMRGLRQVVVNGVLLSLVPAIGFVVYPSPFWFALSVAGIAAATGDTWAGEIGRHVRHNPVSLRTMSRVPAGTSGAVTWVGSGASGFGGLAIGSVGALVAGSPSLVLLGVAAGLLGSLTDSVVGAVWQGSFDCPRCNRVVEARVHCDVPSKAKSGHAWIDNDVVNAFANGTGMSLAIVAVLVW
jgi:uncharacterized protein (TIGR00297 family)